MHFDEIDRAVRIWIFGITSELRSPHFPTPLPTGAAAGGHASTCGAAEGRGALLRKDARDTMDCTGICTAF